MLLYNATCFNVHAYIHAHRRLYHYSTEYMHISIAHISWFLSHPCTYGELHYYYCYMFMPTLWLDWHPKMLNRLWLGDVIWRHRSRSTLAQVMAWCHQVPRHSLMSTYHQVWTVAFTWDQFTRKKVVIPQMISCRYIDFKFIYCST